MRRHAAHAWRSGLHARAGCPPAAGPGHSPVGPPARPAWFATASGGRCGPSPRAPGCVRGRSAPRPALGLRLAKPCRPWPPVAAPVSACVLPAGAMPLTGFAARAFRHARRATADQAGRPGGSSCAPLFPRCRRGPHRRAGLRGWAIPRWAWWWWCGGRHAFHRPHGRRCGAAPARAGPADCLCERSWPPRVRPAAAGTPCPPSGVLAARRAAGRPPPLRRRRQKTGRAPSPTRGCR